jgi:ribosomal protein S27AE
MSLEIHLNGFKEDFEQIAERCGINWNEEKVFEVISQLFNVCTFIIPETIDQAFEDKNIAKLYVQGWLNIEPEKNNLETYEYFQNIMDEMKMKDIFPLYPYLLGINNRPYFGGLVSDNKLFEISQRAIYFTNDLVIAFCNNNPILEAYIGDYIAQKTVGDYIMDEQTFVHCPKCGMKNNITKHNRNLIAKCGKCGNPLEIVNEDD